MTTSTLRSRITLNALSFALHRLRKRVAMMVAYTTDWALFIGIVLILGLGSSWYMIERGSSLTTVSVGPWVSWTSAGRPDADPYTRANAARLGILPLSTTVSQTYVARVDDDGRALHSSCDYEVEGQEATGFWWSLAVYDAQGQLIPNTLERFAFTSDTVAINSNGSYVVKLSRDANPGNWLPVGGAGKLVLVFTVIDLDTRSISQDDDLDQLAPAIVRKAC
jgi:hypothetical protein